MALHLTELEDRVKPAALRPVLEPSRQLRTVRNLAVVRWAAIAWAAVQVATYYLPYPPGALAWAVVAIGVLLVGNTAIWLASTRVGGPAEIRRLAVASVMVDAVAILALVFVYTFDTETAIWAVLYIVPLGAAALFQLRGALWTMAAVTVLYTVREIYGSVVYDNELLPVSISFRMGVGFIISAFAGAMASGLVSRLGELRVLNRITSTVADARELRSALDAVASEMRSMLSVRATAIALFEDDQRSVSILSESTSGGAELSALDGRSFRTEAAPFLADLVRDGGAMVLSGPDDPTAGPELGAVMRDRGSHVVLVVPLQVRSNTIGAILIESDEPSRRFSANEVSLAETVAGQIAGAIANARLFDEMLEYVEQVRQVTDAAGEVESGNFRAESLDAVGSRRDALGQLARVFQRMAREIVAREQRMRQEVRQLRIEIDEAHAARQVEDITESDYFRRLEEKVDQLRIDTATPGGG